MPTCDGLIPVVLKNTRSPARTSAADTPVPTRYCSTTVRGTAIPCCARTYQTSPLQSNPFSGYEPPLRYRTPQYARAVLASGSGSPGAATGASIGAGGTSRGAGEGLSAGAGAGE